MTGLARHDYSDDAGINYITLMDKKIIRELEKLLGSEAVISAPDDLLLYEYDGSVEEARPDCVVFPRTTADVSAIARISAKHRVPMVGRGAGTGLSGGALAVQGGILTVFSRMNRIVEIDEENLRAVVQPGVVNLDVTRAVEHLGLYFAPDPSSQKACTIGGNVAENAGGPHTLAYGVTTNHVTGLELVLPSGDVVRVGGKTCEAPGYDLTGLMVGSEGTLAMVTEITLKLSRKPEAVKTLLAVFDEIEDAPETVADFTGRAITPAACEMLDGWTLRAVEAFVHAGFPLDSGAVLLIEVEGLKEAVEEQAIANRGDLQIASRPRSARGAECRGTRFTLERAEKRVRRGGKTFAELLRAGRGDSANQSCRKLCERLMKLESVTDFRLEIFFTRVTGTCIRLFYSISAIRKNSNARWWRRERSCGTVSNVAGR